jgi:F-type H+-transporting ATPase subunit delta
MIRAASRHAMADLRRRLDESATGASVDDLTALARELYEVGTLLVGQARLRRTLGDPATQPEARVALVRRLLDGKAGARTVDVVDAAVRLRWSSPWDLTDGLELCGDDSLMRAAEEQGALDEVEDEMFRFERVLDAEPRLATLLDDAAVPADARVALIRDILAAKVHPVTEALLEHAVASTRKRSTQLAIDDLLQAAADRRDRSVARVTSAVLLTDQQEQRLASVLSRLYGRAIEVRTAVEPSVQGGLLIRIGDEVIDGSVASRFAAARAALTR